MNQIPTHKKTFENNLFAGRTKNEIAHAYFCAKLFGTSVEEQLKPVVFSPSHYEVKELILDEDYFENRAAKKRRI